MTERERRYLILFHKQNKSTSLHRITINAKTISFNLISNFLLFQLLKNHRYIDHPIQIYNYVYTRI